ncbi:hypothetical protein N7463_001701, partial [Penicillium fimorum]
LSARELLGLTRKPVRRKTLDTPGQETGILPPQKLASQGPLLPAQTSDSSSKVALNPSLLAFHFSFAFFCF